MHSNIKCNFFKIKILLLHSQTFNLKWCLCEPPEEIKTNLLTPLCNKTRDLSYIFLKT